jgi:hypothetical protein
MRLKIIKLSLRKMRANSSRKEKNSSEVETLKLKEKQ